MKTDAKMKSGNKLIVEFMGDNTDNKDFYGDFSGCKYHSDWNWLMPVIAKITNECEEPEELDGVKYALLCNDIETAYTFVIDYLNQ